MKSGYLVPPLVAFMIAARQTGKLDWALVADRRCAVYATARIGREAR